MDWFWFWFFLLFIPLFCIIPYRRRRSRIVVGTITTQTPVVYTVPAQVYVQPVHNNFPNTRHVSGSTIQVEQRLNQHYAAQQQPPMYNQQHQPPPPYNPNQRY